MTERSPTLAHLHAPLDLGSQTHVTIAPRLHPRGSRNGLREGAIGSREAQPGKAGESLEDGASYPSSLMKQYDLTRTEARITGLLVQGHTVRSIARLQGVEANTIRMQLKSVFSKTGVHRQAQLVSFMTQKPFGWLSPS